MGLRGRIKRLVRQTERKPLGRSALWRNYSISSGLFFSSASRMASAQSGSSSPRPSHTPSRSIGGKAKPGSPGNGGSSGESYWKLAGSHSQANPSPSASRRYGFSGGQEHLRFLPGAEVGAVEIPFRGRLGFRCRRLGHGFLRDPSGRVGLLALDLEGVEDAPRRLPVLSAVSPYL